MKTIAITGKGGTGKSTLAASVIHWLCQHRSSSILAVDADSNVNLNDLLGVEIERTVGSIREEMKTMADRLPGGMTKQQFLEYKIQTSLVESPEFDLIAMGRPEGAGCYCYANNLLRDILLTLSRNYDFTVIDNEAGMEHLSRRTAQDIDLMLIVSDPSIRGIRAAGKISQLITELQARVKESYLVLNRTVGSLSSKVKDIIRQEKLQLLSSIPEDEKYLRMEQQGFPVWNVLPELSFHRAVSRILDKLKL